MATPMTTPMTTTQDGTSRANADEFQSFEEIQAALRGMSLESSNVVFAVDYTAANQTQGEVSFHGRSLHTIDPNRALDNPYEEIMSRIGRVMNEFDDDQCIPVYGFGDATTTSKSVFSLTPAAAGCRGFRDALQQYRNRTPYVSMAGPFNLAPAIRATIALAQQAEKSFHLLFIIAANGDLTPECERDTIAAIVEAANHPIAIVVLGVGDGPWPALTKFDDHLPQRRFDNFQFVNYTQLLQQARSKFPNEDEDLVFVMYALMEVPAQYHAMKRENLL